MSWTILNKRMNSSFYFKLSWCNSTYYSESSYAKQLARQRVEWILSPKQKWRPLPCLLYKSFFYGGVTAVTLVLITCEHSITNLRCWIGGDVGGVTFFVVRMMAGLHLISFYHLRYLHLSQAPEKLQSKYKNNFV